ncbi:MAG: PIN domain-containing protein [Solirubrobacterales bacterium]|nr:PIN domain-containing protein [Solirubrobacterales bacterium]
MTVADASAVLDVILRQARAAVIGAHLARLAELHVPEHFHVEAISALRRLRLRGGLSEHAAQQSLRSLARLRVVRYPVLGLSETIWSLRDQLTAYDAAYLALALRLGAELVTSDAALAAAAEQHGVPVALGRS